MRKLTIGILCLLMAVVTSAGPIRGLVDIGTGQEVPDADSRYVLAGITNQTATFSNLYAIGVASGVSQIEVVNWQSMTNYVAGISTPGLSNVLAISNDGGGQNITNVYEIWAHTVNVSSNSLNIGGIPLSQNTESQLVWNTEVVAQSGVSQNFGDNTTQAMGYVALDNLILDTLISSQELAHVFFGTANYGGDANGAYTNRNSPTNGHATYAYEGSSNAWYLFYITAVGAWSVQDNFGNTPLNMGWTNNVGGTGSVSGAFAVRQDGPPYPFDTGTLTSFVRLFLLVYVPFASPP